jgi:hypothetical protein
LDDLHRAPETNQGDAQNTPSAQEPLTNQDLGTGEITIEEANSDNITSAISELEAEHSRTAANFLNS